MKSGGLRASSVNASIIETKTVEKKPEVVTEKQPDTKMPPKAKTKVKVKTKSKDK